MEFEGAFFDTSEYKKTSKNLGEGSFGQVIIVKNRKDRKLFAAKIINNESVISSNGQLLLIRESSILAKLDHPAIVKFIGINFHSFDDPQFLRPTILMEYLPNGSLKEILKKGRNGLLDDKWSPTKKFIILLGISNAMKYLHAKGILHRDLKPENILIDANYYPRICDFGMSRCFSQALSKSTKLTMSGKYGTPLYMAPEILDYDDHPIGPGADVYAFAIIAYEIVSGREPFMEKEKPPSFGKVIQKVLSGKRPKIGSGITDPMKNLLTRCWNKDADERPSFEEIFNELSSGAIFLDEDVDQEEINNYLVYLNESKKDEKEDLKHKYDLLVKKLEKETELSRKLFECFAKNINNFETIKVSSYGGNLLHLACKYGNLDLVKYIISLDKIDIASKDVFIYLFLILFHIQQV